MDAAILDYGALGLLALVLVSVGAFLRNYLNRQQDTEREDRTANRQEQQRLNEEFRKIITYDIEARLALAASMSGICEAVTKVQADTAAAFESLETRMAAGDRRACERHEQTTAQAGEMLTALRQITGLSK